MYRANWIGEGGEHPSKEIWSDSKTGLGSRGGGGGEAGGGGEGVLPCLDVILSN